MSDIVSFTRNYGDDSTTKMITSLENVYDLISFFNHSRSLHIGLLLRLGGYFQLVHTGLKPVNHP